MSTLRSKARPTECHIKLEPWSFQGGWRSHGASTRRQQEGPRTVIGGYLLNEPHGRGHHILVFMGIELADAVL